MGRERFDTQLDITYLAELLPENLLIFDFNVLLTKENHSAL